MKKMGDLMIAGMLWGFSIYYFTVFIKEEFGPKK